MLASEPSTGRSREPRPEWAAGGAVLAGFLFSVLPVEKLLAAIRAFRFVGRVDFNGDSRSALWLNPPGGKVRVSKNGFR